ncbi:MAG: NADH:flavin oxidoreductase [Deltaproteobacteria bacterium]|nr:NADH:flavin oxidoreductase [Deltaproteobacteria bacterium]
MSSYRPPERIRHSLPVLGAPGPDEVARARLFSSLRLASGLELAERTWVPAMVPWRATEEGFVSREVLAWYRRFAEGQPGAIVVEATGVRDIPSGPLLRIGHDRYLEGLGELVRAVREASAGRTRLFIQLIDFLRIRRRPEPSRYFERFLALRVEHRRALADLRPELAGEATDESVRRAIASLSRSELEHVLSRRELEALDRGERERVWDLEQPEIRDLPKALPSAFAAAAQRAREAGFDGVELHYAHAYTMASFLSPLNTRDDGYGGDRAGRLRLPLEVFAAVRARVGASFTVGCRFLCDEIVEGGGRTADAEAHGVAFAAAGMDFLSLSTGGKFEDAAQPRIGEAAYPYTGRSGWECMPTIRADERGPFGRNIPRQAAVRRAVRAAGYATPVVLCGGIASFEQAEAHLRAGDGDVIGAARQSLADPDWFRKIRSGFATSVRRCTYSNYCEALDQRHQQITCQLWDRIELDEPRLPLAKDGKRRLVAPPWSPEPAPLERSGARASDEAAADEDPRPGDVPRLD